MVPHRKCTDPKKSQKTAKNWPKSQKNCKKNMFSPKSSQQVAILISTFRSWLVVILTHLAEQFMYISGTELPLRGKKARRRKIWVDFDFAFFLCFWREFGKNICHCLVALFLPFLLYFDRSRRVISGTNRLPAQLEKIRKMRPKGPLSPK